MSTSQPKSPRRSLLRALAGLSLTTKLITSFLLVALVPLVIMAYFNTRITRNALTDSTNQALFAAAAQTAASVDGFMRTNLEIIDFQGQTILLSDFLKASSAEREGMVTAVTELLNAFKNRSNSNFTRNDNVQDTNPLTLDVGYVFIQDYTLLDKNGVVVADTTIRNLGKDFSEADYFQQPLAHPGAYVSNITFADGTNLPSLNFATRVGEPALGVLVMSYNPIVLQELVKQSNGLAGESSTGILVDENNLVLAHGLVIESLYKVLGQPGSIDLAALQESHRLPKKKTENLFLDIPDLAQGFRNSPQQPYFTFHNTLSESAENEQVATIPLRVLPWRVGFLQSEEVFLTAVSQQNRANVGFAAVIAGLVILVAAGFTRFISYPLTRLTAVAEQITSGDLTARAKVTAQDETGRLAMAFNAMTDELSQLVSELEKRVEIRTAELAQRVEQLNLINLTGQSITSVLDLKYLLPKIAQLTRDKFNYYAVVVLLVDHETEIIFVGAADTAEKVDLSILPPLRFGQGLIGHVAQTGQPLMVNDVLLDARYQAIEELSRTRSELVLPLRSGDTILGMLDLQSTEVGSFAPDDVQVLQTLADQIATAIKNAELFQTAQLARADAEEANRLKSDFLANMSHEIRTPLNAIINFAYLMIMGLEGEVTSGQRDMLTRINDAGQHLLGLINDILDLAKIESGRMDLYLEEVDVRPLIEGVKSTALGLIKGKPVQVNVDLPDHLPVIQADRTRLRQVLLNLLSNAAKFTEKGSITIHAEQTPDQHMLITVQDTGQGVAEEDLPKMFLEFVQVGPRQTKGTGLGLPISQRFIRMHGGELWAESELGVGSTFFIKLPFSAPVP